MRRRSSPDPSESMIRVSPRVPRAAALAFCAALATAPSAPAQVPAALPDENPYAIGTFESLGLYYRAPDVGEVRVRFREAGAAEWREGLSLWRDDDEGEYRGSLVYLRPGTAYEVELIAAGGTVSLAARTRSDEFPIGKVTELPAGDSYRPIVIDQSGSPDAYHLVTAPQGGKSTVDLANSAPVTVTVDADYVIVRGLELKNAGHHGILIREGRHDVVIEDNRIVGWGRGGGGVTAGSLGNTDSGITAERGTRNLVIQRNLVENPRGGSNDWRTGHPAGPQGVTIWHSQGGNIIRYNTIRSSEEHGFNDGIGGGANFSDIGNLNRDSDVYGNYIRNAWDDAIEVEGANANVRIWGNYIEKTFQHIATASTSRGPIYIFRNVLGEARRSPVDPIGGSLIKVGDRDGFGGGRRFLFHNTALQPRGGFHAFTSAADPVAYSRNNVWSVPGMMVANRLPEEYPRSDFAYDVFTGLRVGAPEIPHRVVTNPSYADDHGLTFYPATWTEMVKGGKIELPYGDGTRIVTDPVMSTRNLMIDGGVRIPNFNDDFTGLAPDVGAFEVGRPPLRFGREGIDAPRAPWQ